MERWSRGEGTGNLPPWFWQRKLELAMGVLPEQLEERLTQEEFEQYVLVLAADCTK